jgi:hypothetical protein
MQVRLKYITKVTGIAFPAGTILDVIPAEDERVQRVWPNIQKKLESKIVAVQFPHLSFPTFVHMDQVEFLKDEAEV